MGYDSMACDSRVYESMVNDSTEYDSMAYDSRVYYSTVYDSMAYSSMVYGTRVYESTVYDSTAYDSHSTAEARPYSKHLFVYNTYCNS